MTRARATRPRGLADRQLQQLGLPRTFGLVHMLASAGGVFGCVRCQHFPYAARSQGARS